MILRNLVRFGFAAQMAFHGLWTHPLRSLLTILSVAIGVAAVVSLIGIGEGARRSVVEQFASLGENVIIIETRDTSVSLRPDLPEELVRRVEGLEYATPVVSLKSTVRWRRARGEAELLGVNAQFPVIRDHPLAAGRFLTDLHVRQRARVAVLGFRFAQALPGGRNPVGQTITLDGLSFRIIGVLAPKGEGQAENIDQKILIPYTTAQQMSQTREIHEIWAKTASAEWAELAVTQLGRIFRREIGLDPAAPEPEHPGEGGTVSPGGGDGFGMGMPGPWSGRMDVLAPMPFDPGAMAPNGGGVSSGGNLGSLSDPEQLIAVTNLNQMVEHADEANRIMTLLLGGIAAVSLLVGGIGIMNMMLVSVTERTAEIGLRKALGARRADLLAQFLIEALLLGAVGGLLGVGVGVLSAGLVGRFGLEAVITLQATSVALGLALGVSVLFGVYPGWLASGLRPVEALRRVG